LVCVLLRLFVRDSNNQFATEEDGMNTNRPSPAGQQQQQQGDDQSNAIKDPNEWKTGDEPMTGAQRSYLKTLSDEAKEPFDENLSKADASKRIDELQEKTGRGK
jgi:hypothetical protein